MVAAVALVCAACGTSTIGNAGNGDTAPTAANRAYAGPGPYAAGTARVTLADGDAAQLWYPVDPAAVAGRAPYVARAASWLPGALASEPALSPFGEGVPTDSWEGVPPAAADGQRFPAVLYAHTTAGTPEEATFLTDHLASWGFVVLAPDFRTWDLAAALTPEAAGSTTTVAPASASVDELTTALGYLTSADTDPTSILHDRLDLGRVGVVGFGSGGGDALSLAAEDPAVATYVALAPTTVSTSEVRVPGLVAYGSRDLVVTPASVQELWAGLPTPKRLVVVSSAGHNVFDDVCTVGTGSRRLVAELQAAHGSEELVDLAGLDVDGCLAPDVDPVAVRPLVLQVTTAQLRAGLGIDGRAVGLDDGLDHAFPGVDVSYYEKR